MQLKARRNRRGFTLIELLVVVLILAVLMAVSIPLYLSAVADSQKKTCRANMQTIANAVQASRVKNNSTDYDQPSFVPFQIDKRTGSIHAVPVDINGDKRPDVITLFAQEHETVVAFLNQGGMRFDPHTIYEAPHPNWGSSGIQVVDLDKDGDLDVLMTHGDTFDDDILKAYHGIQWLENKGTYPFTEHTIATLAGVQRAQAVDLDGDGDLDIVACALLAAGSDVDEKTLPALVWLEQTKAGVWVKHTIEMGMPRHASLDVGDIDGDGVPDIVTGTFSIANTPQPWVDVWLTRQRR